MCLRYLLKSWLLIVFIATKSVNRELLYKNFTKDVHLLSVLSFGLQQVTKHLLKRQRID